MYIVYEARNLLGKAARERIPEDRASKLMCAVANQSGLQIAVRRRCYCVSES